MNKFIATIIVVFSAGILATCYFLFGRESFGFYYLVGNLLVVVISMLLFSHAMRAYSGMSVSLFERKIFWLSLIYRTVGILVIYYVLYHIIGGNLSIEEYDTTFYDFNGRVLSTFYKTGTMNADLKSFISDVDFDDKGYIYILSVIYYFFDNLLFAKLVQGVVDSFSVILIFRISLRLYGENIAKTTAILAAVFFPLIVMASLQTKEVFLIFFLLLSVNYTLKITNQNISIKNILLIAFSLIALFSMRVILGFIVSTSILFYIFINQRQSIFTKILVPLALFGLLVLTLRNLDKSEEVQDKMRAYFGLETPDVVVLSGRSTSQYVSKGQHYAKYATGIFLLPQVISTPYPSLVKTNIKDFNTTMQWFFAGGLFIWSFISFFAFIGIYRAFKYDFKRNSLIVAITFLYIIVLVASVYITSIRFNIPKLVFLLIFAAVGLNNKMVQWKRYFFAYAIVMSLIIIGWNFIKLSGRGLI